MAFLWLALWRGAFLDVEAVAVLWSLRCLERSRRGFELVRQYPNLIEWRRR